MHIIIYIIYMVELKSEAKEVEKDFTAQNLKKVHLNMDKLLNPL